MFDEIPESTPDDRTRCHLFNFSEGTRTVGSNPGGEAMRQQAYTTRCIREFETERQKEIDLRHIYLLGIRKSRRAHGGSYGCPSE